MGAERGIGFQGELLSLRHSGSKAQSRHGCASPSCLVGVPNITAKAVLHAVAQKQPQNILSFLQQAGKIVPIEVDQVVRSADIRSQRAFGDLFSVYKQPVESQSGNHDLRGIRLIFQSEATAKIRGRHLPVMVRIFITGADKLLRELCHFNQTPP